MGAGTEGNGTAEKVRMVCSHCGSDEVTRDAWAAWDPQAQQWALRATFDYAFCHRCMTDARIEEVPC
ncbi:hypothetical protein [Novosphingobium sp. JCM 18896]|uniref:hypothetical protein n=1 Tax=Novosphingobium sp. JCM 18896 TaxID=2989731 RepID=UPI0022218525|nr:hypothetical protein [Novosphingobium sp. JCM 18896]MCW1431864.1 hypothetical protein [Novosphingobium sp. JCM 18896]